MVGTPTDDGEVELLPGGVDVADDIFGKNLQGGRTRARCEDAPEAHRRRAHPRPGSSRRAEGASAWVRTVRPLRDARRRLAPSPDPR